MSIIYPFSRQECKRWPLGTTTELFIYPPEGSFAERDFDFRISTATVESETSKFSDFSGFERFLMILEGELHIHHEDHYSKKLAALDHDRFDGSWNTRAEGKVRDFNIIFKPGTQVETGLKTCFESLLIIPKGNHHFVFIIDGGELEFNGIKLQQYDLVYLTEATQLDHPGSEKARFLEIIVG